MTEFDENHERPTFAGAKLMLMGLCFIVIATSDRLENIQKCRRLEATSSSARTA